MNFNKLKIVDKFIFSQVFQATLVCLFLFIIIWIAPERLREVINEILKHEITIREGIMRLIYELPKVLSKALPVSILLGSIFTFDKLSKDSELAILRGIGLSFSRLMMPVIVLGAALSIGCYFVGDQLIPHSIKFLTKKSNYNKHFVYIQKDEKNRPKQGVIVSNFTPRGIKNIIVVNFATSTYDDVALFKTILFAPYALKLDNKWILPDATEYYISSNGVFEENRAVKDYPIIQGADADDVFNLMVNATKRDRDFTNEQLFNYLALLKKHNYEDEYNYMLTKFYQRFFHPTTCILFAIIGCMLGFSPPRSARMVGFTLAVGLVFLYYITQPPLDLLAEKNYLSPLIGAALPILSFIATIFIIKKVKDL